MAAVNYWLWLTTRKGIGARGVLRLLEYFGTPERVYFALQDDLEPVPGLPPQGVRSLLDKSMEESDAILGRCDQLGVHIMTIQDADYPERLRQLDDPPVVLYILGHRIRFDEEAAFGVVGARNPSAYGQEVAPMLGLELARHGALLVSGIAQGIDSLALRGALKGGGRVVSVLAGGVDVPYPLQNRYLYQDVAAVGALISEYPPGTRHKAEHFPIRNRIISGLSLGVVAVECARFSGTMLTINHALEQNRDVCAVPGSIFAPMSQGPNWLLQQGARPVMSGEDILMGYWDQFPQKLIHAPAMDPQQVRERLGPPPKAPREEAAPQPPSPRPDEKETAQRPKISLSQQRERFTDDQLVVLHAMLEGADTADELVERTQIPARRVLSALTMLQVDGAAEQHAGGRYAPLVELE